jgi:hypothetical protein
VTLKEYGKAKVFLINQDRFPPVDTTLLEKMDEQINVRRQEFNTLTEESKELARMLGDATASQTNEEIMAQIEKLRLDNEILLDRL